MDARQPFPVINHSRVKLSTSHWKQALLANITFSNFPASGELIESQVNVTQCALKLNKRPQVLSANCNIIQYMLKLLSSHKNKLHLERCHFNNFTLVAV